jgi:hypothetical protein
METLIKLSAAKQFAEKLEFQCPAPKGAFDFNRLAVSPNGRRKN